MMDNLTELSLNDLVKLLATRSKAVQATQLSIAQLDRSASQDDVARIHDASVAFMELGAFVLQRARERDNEPLSTSERQQVTYLVNNVPDAIDRTQQFIRLLRQHFPSLLAS